MSVRVSLRLLTLLAAVTCVPTSTVDADWLVTPYAGTAFGGETSLLILQASNVFPARTVFGVSGGWLGQQVLGFEADVMFGPGFFGSGNGNIVGSSVTTLSGGVVVAVPLSITRESLRPYATVGLGTSRATISYSADLFPEHRSLQPALQLGGGAIGFVSRRTGYRFDLRHVRSLSREADPLTTERGSPLTFWRLTIGVVVRVG